MTEQVYKLGYSKTPKPFSLWKYLLAVIALSWPFQLWFIFRSYSSFDKYLYSSLAMVMVTIATLIAARFIFRDGFGNAGWNWGKPKHYILVLLFACLIWLTPGIFELSTGVVTLPVNIKAGSIVLMFCIYFIATLIPAFGEEFGWRGYMLPGLVARYGAKKGLLIHAFVWWFWHLPVLIGMALQEQQFVTDRFANVIIMIFISIIPTMLHAIIFAFIWAKTGSLAVAVVYHAAFDEIRDTWERTVGFGPLVEIWQLAVIIIAGGLLLWKSNWIKLLPFARPENNPLITNRTKKVYET